MPVAWVLLDDRGPAGAHVVLGPGVFARRSGPTDAPLDVALAWARSVASRVVLTTPHGRFDAGAEAGGLPAWDGVGVDTDWPALTAPRAGGWSAALGLDLEDDALLEALAAELGGHLARGARRIDWTLPGGARDVRRHDAEEAVDRAWEAVVARLGRAPTPSVTSLEVDPVGAVTPGRPTLALLEGREGPFDDAVLWDVVFHGEDGERSDAPHRDGFAACVAYARPRADVVLARVERRDGSGGAFVDAGRFEASA